MIRAIEYQSSELNLMFIRSHCPKRSWSVVTTVYTVHPSWYQNRFAHNVPREHQEPDESKCWLTWPLSDQVQIRAPKDTSGCRRHARKCSIQFRLGCAHVAELADMEIIYAQHPSGKSRVSHILARRRSMFKDPISTICTPPHRY